MTRRAAILLSAGLVAALMSGMVALVTGQGLVGSPSANPESKTITVEKQIDVPDEASGRCKGRQEKEDRKRNQEEKRHHDKDEKERQEDEDHDKEAKKGGGDCD
jgi:hypothetical protein